MKLSTREYFGKSGRTWSGAGFSITASRYESAQEQPWHTHELPTFFVQLGGEHVDECELGSWEQPALSVSCHPSDSPHRSRIGPRPLLGVNIEVEEAWLNGYDLAIPTLGRQRILDGCPASIAGMRLAHALSFGADAGVLDELVVELISEFTSESLDASQVSNPKWLTRAEDHLRSSFQGDVSLKTLAAEANVHPVHLARLFRRRHGCSVSESKNRLRSLDAARRVVDQGQTLGAAALEAGFYDQFHLSRVFHRLFGFRPIRLRALASIVHEDA